MRIKRILSLALCFALVGCSGSSGDSTRDASVTSTDVAVKEASIAQTDVVADESSVTLSETTADATEQATEIQESETEITETAYMGNDPVSGKIIILNSLFEGYLYTTEKAADLYKNIDPNLSKNNKKYVELYENGERYYDEKLNVTFVYNKVEDDLQFHLGSNKCDIYDFSERDFSSPEIVDLSKSGMNEYKKYESVYGNSTLYR